MGLRQLALVLAPLGLAQRLRLPPHQLRLAEQVHEDAHLGAEDVRLVGLEEVVHRAHRVGAQLRHLPARQGGEEEDGRVAAALALADELRRLEAVHLRHDDVQQDDGEVLVSRWRSASRPLRAGDEPLPQRRQRGLQRQQPLGLVVHQEDGDARSTAALTRCTFRLRGARTSRASQAPHGRPGTAAPPALLATAALPVLAHHGHAAAASLEQRPAPPQPSSCPVKSSPAARAP